MSYQFDVREMVLSISCNYFIVSWYDDFQIRRPNLPLTDLVGSNQLIVLIIYSNEYIALYLASTHQISHGLLIPNCTRIWIHSSAIFVCRIESRRVGIGGDSSSGGCCVQCIAWRGSVLSYNSLVSLEVGEERKKGDSFEFEGVGCIIGAILSLIINIYVFL